MALDVYIDINILLLFACVLWLAATAGLRAAGLGHAVSARLALLAVGVAMDFTLTDFILSQYLQGRFQMHPSTLESMLTLRGSWPHWPS